MSAAIGGKKREVTEFSRKIGLGEFEPVAVNPDKEELETLLGIELEKDVNYLSEDTDGNDVVRLTFYLREVKDKGLFNVSFFIKNKDKETKEDSEDPKYQWINSTGQTTWLGQDLDEDNLPDWFTKNGQEVRKAKVGEEEFYNFLRSWVQLDFSDSDAKLHFDTKKLLKGNVKELRSLFGSEYTEVTSKTTGKTSPATVVAVATVKNKEIDGEKKAMQIINNKFFLPGYAIKFFNNKQYTVADAKKITKILKGNDKKAIKEVKPYQRFIASVLDEQHGVKEHFGSFLGTFRDYDPSEDLTAGDEVIQEETDDSSY